MSEPITVMSGGYIGGEYIRTTETRIPDSHLRKPCPDSPSYRTTGSQVEQWVPGTGWVDITPGVVLSDD